MKIYSEVKPVIIEQVRPLIVKSNRLQDRIEDAVEEAENQV